MVARYAEGLHRSEITAFLEENNTGFLAFAGDEPYVIPMGYTYRRETVLLGLITKPRGRKMVLLEESPKICYTICRTRAQTNLKHPCTTVILEGELNPVTDRAYYGLSDLSEKVQQEFGLVLYRIVPTTVSGRRCTRKPCELMVPAPGET
jgi:nitroimidazol reductase NimA-like FMN-containing flavoprotein (pyridoxamine 5'-phosphate oxidase superfamily)